MSQANETDKLILKETNTEKYLILPNIDVSCKKCTSDQIRLTYLA